MDAQQVHTVDTASAIKQVAPGTLHSPSGECADLLRDQIHMLESTLVPGGAWDKRIADAEETIARLKFERRNALQALTALRDALEEVIHRERPVSAESRQSSSIKGDRLSLAHDTSRAA